MFDYDLPISTATILPWCDHPAYKLRSLGFGGFFDFGNAYQCECGQRLTEIELVTRGDI
jgi:hypothetical protein